MGSSMGASRSADSNCASQSFVIRMPPLVLESTRMTTLARDETAPTFTLSTVHARTEQRLRDRAWRPVRLAIAATLQVFEPRSEYAHERGLSPDLERAVVRFAREVVRALQGLEGRGELERVGVGLHLSERVLDCLLTLP